MVTSLRATFRRLSILMLTGVLAGCAAPVSEDLPELVWPDAPNAPRVVYVREYARAQDFGIAKSLFERLGDFLVGSSDLRLIRPMAVVAAKGVVFVADPGSGGVHRFDSAAQRHDLIGGAEGSALPSPVGLALGSEGEIYVTDSELGQVLVIRPGAKVAVALALPGLGQPTGIAFDPETRMLSVVDTAAHRVNVFKPDGTLAFGFGARGTGEGEFNFPTLLWRDAKGRLYVTDSLNFRVQIFDAQGRFLSQFGRAGDGAGDNMRPKSVATDSYGHVYVTDALLNAVQIFDQRGRYLLSVGGVGRERGEFWLPAGIFIGADDTIYVADSYNRRVQVLRYIGGPT